MRKVELDNQELFNLVKENNVHLTEIRKILDEGEKLEKEMDNVQKKYKKAETKQLKTLDKLRPVAKSVTADIECSEFEYIKEIQIEDGKLYAVVEDAEEVWKTAYREKRNTISKVKETIEK